MEKEIMEKRKRKTNSTIQANQPPKFTILSFDPSMTGWGYSVIDDKGLVLAGGIVKTEPSPKVMRIRKADDKVRRIEEINAVLIPLIAEHSIKLIISELPHGSQSASAAIMLGIVAGIAQTIADCFRIPIEWYSEGDVKSFLFHRQSVTKTEMREYMLKKHPEAPWTGIGYRDEAVADSLGIYAVAYSKSNFIKFMMK